MNRCNVSGEGHTLSGRGRADGQTFGPGVYRGQQCEEPQKSKDRARPQRYSRWLITVPNVCNAEVPYHMFLFSNRGRSRAPACSNEGPSNSWFISLLLHFVTTIAKLCLL